MRRLTTVLLLLLVAGIVWAQETRREPLATTAAPVRQGPKQLSSHDRNIGRLVPNASFTDIAGKSLKLSELTPRTAIVVAMTSTSCPLSKKYLPTLARLEQMYAPKGVSFLFVNPIAADKRLDMEATVKSNALRGPYVADATGSLAQAVGATTTTDVIVLDAARTVIYHGAIDDQYGFGYALDTPRVSYLTAALEAILAGTRPTVVATEAPGCDLEVPVAKLANTTVTYHNRISRLMQQHCVECHRDGGVGPFSLTELGDVTAHAAMIKKVVERGVMPPWFAVKNETEPKAHSPWSNDRSLPEQDKADLLAWLSSTREIGNPQDAPLTRQFAGEWTLGKPDAVVQLPQPIAIKATGTMNYQNAIVPTNFDEDKWVQSYEFQPSDRGVVHHVLVFIHSTPNGGSERVDEARGFFAGYVPGNNRVVFPEGYAKRLPKGAVLRFQLHYTPNGTATTDQTRLGFTFAKQQPQHEVHTVGIPDARLDIPPGAANHSEAASLKLPFDVDVLAYMPHMHLRGKAFRYEATLPGEQASLLLDVPRYDFNWQLQYRLAEPLHLPTGTTINVTGWYDNSTGNPANPDATRTVHWGPQSDDEMLIGYFEYTVPGAKPGEGPSLGRGGRSVVGSDANTSEATFRRLDADNDGKLSLKELDRLGDLFPPLKERPQLLELLFNRLDTNGDKSLDASEFTRIRDAASNLR